ncbi:RagB/SusD family nutrient uptake outer membrane protein, partial [Bacteroides sp. OttesenSCG-928-D19]|nr:RagB/SusD family nutrient uptake outer membrane protein [Bacteroides sp. OttesenSCG-928-D19]
KYHSVNGGSNANAHFDKAINAFERLRGEGHDLFSDFNQVHSYLNEANSVNPEIIFGKAYGENDFSTVSTGHVHTRNMEGSNAFTRNVLDLFLYADGLPMAKTSLKVPVETSYNNVVGLDGEGNPLPDGLGQRDPRLLKSIWTINDELEGDDFVGWMKTGKGKYYPFDSQRPKGYPCKKAFFGSMWEQSSGNKDFTDKIIIRYAEMLVSYAEALYERNGSISDGQLNETVNKLRDRVGFEVKLTNAFVSEHGLDMLEEIRRERTVELLGENFRYDDIIRWKTAEKVLPVDLIGPICLADEMQNPSLHGDFAGRLTDASGYVDGSFVYGQPSTYVIEFKGARSFNPQRDYLYPIPTFEIAQSDFNITQNPGWGQ